MFHGNRECVIDIRPLVAPVPADRHPNCQTLALSSRRQFMRVGLLTTAAAAIVNSPLIGPLIKVAQAATPDLLHDTFNGLLSFIVPGPDAYSQTQGVTSSTLGGVDANVSEVLIETLDLSVPFLPEFSATVAAILTNLAQLVNASATGPFSSPFANLSYAEKVAVLEIMDGTEVLKSLGGVLPLLVAALCYSEAGTFNPATRSLTGTPIGWTISNYSGVSDGRDEFEGYFENKRRAVD
jgi:hypothetical protein